MKPAESLRPALNDEPSKYDLLGYRPYARALAQILTHPELGTPFTVGVFGPWGSGKSSFMVQLMRELREHGHPYVFFQPWIFDARDEVWKALILTIVQYLQEIAPRTTADDADAKLTALASGVARLTVNKLLKASGLQLDVDQLAGELTRASQDATNYVNTFRKDFEAAKSEVLQAVRAQNKADRPPIAKHIEHAERLFVFVDDLDRCTPDGCVMVLEAVKLFFGTQGCVFVMGIDAEIVQQGIEVKYQANPKVRGRDYLEKLIQLPFTLPPVAEDAYQKYVSSVATSFAFSDVSVALILRASDNNPRRVKRLINCLHLIRSAARAIREEERLEFELDENKLALLLILQAQYPGPYLWLTRHPIVPRAQASNALSDANAWPEKLIELVHALRPAYGSAADEVADGFKQLWDFAHANGVPQFVDEKDLRMHLRVSGLVESGDPREVVRLSELLDEQYGERTRPTLSRAPSVEAKLEEPFVEDQDTAKGEVDALENDWNAFWKRPLYQSVFRFPNDELQALFEKRKKLASLLDDLAAKSNAKFGTERRRLRNMSHDAAAKQLRRLARVLQVGAVISVCLALGALYERYERPVSLSEDETKELKESIASGMADDETHRRDEAEWPQLKRSATKFVAGIRLPDDSDARKLLGTARIDAGAFAKDPNSFETAVSLANYLDDALTRLHRFDQRAIDQAKLVTPKLLVANLPTAQVAETLDVGRPKSALRLDARQSVLNALVTVATTEALRAELTQLRSGVEQNPKAAMEDIDLRLQQWGLDVAAFDPGPLLNDKQETTLTETFTHRREAEFRRRVQLIGQREFNLYWVSGASLLMFALCLVFMRGLLLARYARENMAQSTPPIPTPP